MPKRTFFHCVDCGKQLGYQGKKQKTFRCEKCAPIVRIKEKPWTVPSGFEKGNQHGKKFVKGQAPTAGSFKKGHEFDFETWVKMKRSSIGQRRSVGTEFQSQGKNTQGTRLKDLKNACFSRDNWTCVECGIHKYVSIHHIKGWATYPKLRYELDNVVTLCVKCHKAKHGRRHLTGRLDK